MPDADDGPPGRRMKEISRYAGPSESPGFLLWRTTNRWQRAIREALAPLGLTHVQFVLLATLTWHEAEGALRQRDLAAIAATDPMMTSQVLRALEARGLVERHPHPTDRRARALTPTPAGRALAERAVETVEAADEAFFSQTDRNALVTILRVLAGEDAHAR